MWVAIATILALMTCFCCGQIRGCQQENNERIANLAKQGIRAEATANGELHIIDVRDAVKEAE
jgi:hypothetical protein